MSEGFEFLQVALTSTAWCADEKSDQNDRIEDIMEGGRGPTAAHTIGRVTSVVLDSSESVFRKVVF